MPRGGARPGAGRKPGPAAVAKAAAQAALAAEAAVAAIPQTKPIDRGSHRDMLEVLQAIAFGEIEVSANQLRAAIAAVQYTHQKTGDGGKKNLQQAKADQVAATGSRFSPAEPPKLAAVK